jgi:hypothetical protein
LLPIPLTHFTYSEPTLQAFVSSSSYALQAPHTQLYQSITLSLTLRLFQQTMLKKNAKIKLAKTNSAAPFHFSKNNTRQK